MKNLTKILPFFALFCFLTSCTTFSVRKVPGKVQKEFPKDLQGEYELTFPAQFQALLLAEGTHGGKTTTINVTIKADRMVYVDSESTRELTLGDSINYSKVGSSTYLSLPGNSVFTVLKMVVDGQDIKLYGMYTEEDVTEKDLSKYFTNIKIQGEDGGEEEVVDDGFGMNNYIVSIKDKKLDAFFSSKLASTDPFVLKRKQ